MEKRSKGKQPLWKKTRYANLIRYMPSKTYFARIRIGGKLIVRTLKTTVFSVAKLRLGDLEKEERQKAEHQVSMADGAVYLYNQEYWEIKPLRVIGGGLVGELVKPISSAALQ